MQAQRVYHGHGACAVRVLRHAATSEHEAAAIGESKARKVHQSGAAAATAERKAAFVGCCCLPRGISAGILAPSALACAVVT
jgi:hypothetical protein